MKREWSIVNGEFVKRKGKSGNWGLGIWDWESGMVDRE